MAKVHKCSSWCPDLQNNGCSTGEGSHNVQVAFTSESGSVDVENNAFAGEMQLCCTLWYYFPPGVFRVQRLLNEA